MTSPTLLSALLAAISVQPATVPAQGTHDALVTIDRPSMVHLTASSGAGTACEVVDKVRGPFERAGTVGRKSCELDLLLDQGTYKLRLTSPAKGKGQVRLAAVPFTEVLPSPMRLVDGGHFEQRVPAGSQLSFWVTSNGKTPLYLRVTGRTAGELRIWRAGVWAEEGAPQHSEARPVPGKPQHEWFVVNPLEAGDHLVTVYGAKPLAWATQPADDTVSVELGFANGPATRQVPFTLGASGSTTIAVPAQPTAAQLSLGQVPSGPVELSIASAGASWSVQSQCTVPQGALNPTCAAFGSGTERLVLRVRGAPGTQGLVEWAPSVQGTTWRGGYYGRAADNLLFDAPAGEALVGVDDLPLDSDAAPLGCQLDRVAKDFTRGVARDTSVVWPGQVLERSFNTEGDSQVWFEVKESNRYRLAAKGKLGARCTLSRFRADGTLDGVRATESGCELTVPLTPATYQLTLLGGRAGIEQLSIREDSQRPLPTQVPTKTSCLMRTTLEAGTHRLALSRGGATARGLVFVPLPLRLEGPVRLVLEPGAKLTLPLAMSQQLEVRSGAGASFSCQGRDVPTGVCRSSGTSELVLGNSGKTAVRVSIGTPAVPVERPGAQAFTPVLSPPPLVAAGTPMFFDFGRGESRSVVFEVEAPGLYQVTTQGLLSTRCALRTPVAPQVAVDQGSGRGRNCLATAYLRQGKYLATASTLGQSQGRGAILLTKRPPVEVAGVTADGDAFFRVEAGALTQQRLAIRAAGEHVLSTTAQGSQVQCRLEDAQGWPLEPVPHACTLTRTLAAGSYLWTQLPLTVESMRHTKLEKVRPPLVLQGNVPHTLEFFTWYQARLGKDGKDELRFTLEGDATVDVVLTNGMQGRLYRLEQGQPPKPVEVIPPTISAPPPEGYEGSNESEGEGEREYGGEGEGEYEREEGSSEEDESQVRGGPAPMAPQAAPRPPSGVQLALPKGSYQLIAEHSRGDVGIEYQVHLGTEALLPGMTRELQAPAEVAVLVPREGTLRLRTRGDVDVRCRVFDERGRLVTESAESGTDWNCALAEPFSPGRYRLSIESETQRPGPVSVALALAPLDEGGALSDGQELTLGTAVQRLSLGGPGPDEVLDFALSSKQPFSCALEDQNGAVVLRRLGVSDCSALVRPLGQPNRLRVWTTEGSGAKVKVAFKRRAVAAGGAGALPDSGALVVTVPRSGRYRTGAGVFCLPKDARGVLEPCGAEASLPQGPMVFSSRQGLPASLALEELVAATGPVADRVDVPLSERPWRQGLRTTFPAIAVIEGTVALGERAAPACTFEDAGGVRWSDERSCAAASGVGQHAIARWWMPPGHEAQSTLTRRALPMPSDVKPLLPGAQTLSWTGASAAYGVGPRSRLDLVLPGDAWAVLLDDQKRAIDLCAPKGEALRRCLLTGARATLVLATSQSTASVTVTALEAGPKPTVLTGLLEDVARAEGSMRLSIPAAAGARWLRIDGATSCLVVRTDGSRLKGCRVPLLEQQSAEVQFEHPPGPWRAVVFDAAKELQATIALEPSGPPAPALAMATAVVLPSARLDRTLTVAQESVLRVKSDGGVCGLFRAGAVLAVDGEGRGCSLWRVVAPGSYQLVVRPFGGAPAGGELGWSAEPVATLADGVGVEKWVGPGQLQVFRFEVQGQAKVGLGLQAPSETLDCSVHDEAGRRVGHGCHQYLSLEKGRYLLAVAHPGGASSAPLRYRPVVLGLQGSAVQVPPEYLQDFFRRIGESR